MRTFRLLLPLQSSADQTERLVALQRTFSEACNAIARVVQNTRCWNRVALHHLAYKATREQFPQLGSQMVCNAIYAVSRTSRLVYQGKNSPFNLALLGNKPLPLLRFMPDSPVYFDRHTLSLTDNQLSMFTLDGRLKFELTLGRAQVTAFHQSKLLEVVMRRGAQGRFELAFQFESASVLAETATPTKPPPVRPVVTTLPDYVSIATP